MGNSLYNLRIKLGQGYFPVVSVLVWSVNQEIISIHLRTVYALEKFYVQTIFLASIFDYSAPFLSNKLKYYLFFSLKLKKNSMALLDSSILSVLTFITDGF